MDGYGLYLKKLKSSWAYYASRTEEWLWLYLDCEKEAAAINRINAVTGV